MADDEPNRPRSRRWLALFVVSLPALYVLSYLIVLWFWSPLYYNATPETRATLKTIYAPIQWAAENNDWFERALIWLIDLKR